MASKIPEMHPVDSTNIQHIGYDPEAKHLHVRFGSGHYVYEDVHAELHAQLMAAGSKGTFHHKHIKGKFASRKL